MESKEESFFVRPIKPEDDNFIISTWLTSYYDQLSHWMKKIPQRNIYMAYNHDKVKASLTRCDILVACSPDDSNHIFGYAVSETMGDCIVLHYMYIKQPYRKSGIAKVFMKLGHSEMSHYTPQANRLDLIYNPYRW